MTVPHKKYQTQLQLPAQFIIGAEPIDGSPALPSEWYCSSYVAIILSYRPALLPIEGSQFHQYSYITLPDSLEQKQV